MVCLTNLAAAVVPDEVLQRLVVPAVRVPSSHP